MSTAPQTDGASPPGALTAAVRLLHPLLFVLGVALAVLALLAAALVWLLRSEAGSHWLLPRLPGVEARGLEGAPLGERFAAEHLKVRWLGGQAWVTITGLRAEELRWHWRPQPGVWLALEAGRLEARRVEVDSGPPSGKPLPPPRSIALPLALKAPAVTLGELQVDRAPLMRSLAASVELGGDGGRVHRVERGSLTLDRSRLDVQGQIGTALPFTLEVQANARPLEGADREWHAALRAHGPLMEFTVEVSLDGQAARGRSAQRLQARASIEPFARWPVAALEASTEGLDLSALAGGAPRTALHGRVDLRGRALDQPLGALVQLDNRAPGPWNEGRLPVARLELDVEGELAQPDRLQARRFEIALAGAPSQGAGSWAGSALWDGHRVEVDSTISDVLPDRLDTRAAAMRIGGPLAFTVTGVPTPQGQGSAGPWAVQWRSSLQGRMAQVPQPVLLGSEGEAAPGRLRVSALRAQVGAAEATGSLELARSGNEAWQVSSEGSLRDFDPLPWWPGEASSAWREGPHRVNAGWKLALRVPTALGGLPWPARLQRLQGQGTLTLRESQLAGVPVSGRFVLENAPGERAPSRLQGELALGANRLEVDGRADPGGDGADDRMRLVLQAPRLAALAPLARLMPEGTAWQPRAGRADATLQIGGRWPAMRTEGEASVEELQTGALAVSRARASWVLDTAAERPLMLQLRADGLAAGEQRAQALRIELQGTLREHRIEFDARVPGEPPQALWQLLALRSGGGARVQLQGEGAWRPQGAGGTWRGRVDRLAVGAGEAGPSLPVAGGEWLLARDLQAEVRVADTGRLERIEAAPGRARVAQTTDLRWDRVQIDFGPERPRLELRADVEPFAVAPLLARLQPSMGWGGSLRLGARVDVRAAERFDAEVVLERTGGDLQVGGGNGVQVLGIDELRATLSAHDGLWSLEPRLRGRTLGEITGALRARTTPQSRWPGAQAPLDGRVQARVADLGIWGVWVPAGWRLTGEVRTTAELGGRLGAPQFTGELRGSGLGARNLLQGVNVGQGDVAVALQGAKARIERFTLRAGEGRLDVAGEADLGEQPQARLQLKAERFRVLGRVDRQLTASGQADLDLRARDIRLRGGLRIDEGLFDLSRRDAPTLDEDVRVRRADEPEGPAAGPAVSPWQPLQMNLDVDLGRALRVRGRGLDASLAGQLRLTTPGGRLNVNGSVNTERGLYSAYGQKLEIERGVIGFNGPLDNPRLDILALRANTDVRVGVAIAGTLTLPRVRLFADPEMSEAEKLSWLLLGRPPDGLDRSDTAMIQRAVVALIAGEGEAPTDALLRNLGLDEFSLRAGEERETVVSVGKQLSRRWFVGYQRSVNATVGTWQLIYRVAQRFTLRAQSGEDSSLDLIWTWRRDEPDQRGVPKSVSLPP